MYFFIFILFFVNIRVVFGDLIPKDSSFMSLKSSEVNLRTGPSLEFPISYSYNLRGYPIKVVGEYDGWYKIVDKDNDSGWINNILLSKQRTVITTKGLHFIYSSAKRENGYKKYRVEENVVAELIKCKESRCKIKIQNKKGWIAKTSIWGYFE